MSVLTKEQIALYLKNPDPRILEAKKNHQQYLVHVHGIGVAEYLQKIEGLESEEKFELRKRLARSNKDLFSTAYLSSQIFSSHFERLNPSTILNSLS